MSQAVIATTVLPFIVLCISIIITLVYAFRSKRWWLIIPSALLALMASHQFLELVDLWNGRAQNSIKFREIPETLVNIGMSGVVVYLAIMQLTIIRLEKEKQQVEEEESRKRRFIANMSHELRTPLNAIIGFSDVIRSKYFYDNVDAYAKYADHINDSAAQLLELVEDLLDITELQEGTYQLQENPANLADILASSTTMVAPLADQRGIAIDWDGAGANIGLRCDERALRQALVNLLKNAVQHAAQRCSIAVESRVEDDVLCIVITDDGPGFDSERSEAVMGLERNAQGEGKNEAQNGERRAGLGLSITRKLIDQHGGRLWLQNVSPRGASATIWLPAACRLG